MKTFIARIRLEACLDLSVKVNAVEIPNSTWIAFGIGYGIRRADREHRQDGFIIKSVPALDESVPEAVRDYVISNREVIRGLYPKLHEVG